MTDHVLQSMNEVISYDYSAGHKAIDVVGSGGSVSNVIAFNSGTVEIVVKDVRYTNHNTTGNATYGNFVKIRHDDGTSSLYAHLKYGSVLVSKGQYVSKGDMIGTMGATGNAYGTHLHFEIRDSSNRNVDPKDYLYGNKSVSLSNSNESSASNDNLESSETQDLSDNSDLSSDEEIGVSESDESNEDSLDLESTDSDLSGRLNEEEYEDFETNDYSSDDFLNESSDSTDYDLLDNNSYSGGSIVDGLKGIGVDSSFDYRSVLAAKNGISDYRGSYCQNVYLLKLLKLGKLKA